MELHEGYVICDAMLRERLLRQRTGFQHYIFLSQQELEKKLYFEIKQSAIYRLMKKYNFSYSLASDYISNLSYIQDQCYGDSTLDSMVSVYHYLQEEQLIKKDQLFLIRLKQYPVTFIDPVHSKEYQRLKKTLEEITTVYEVTTQRPSYQPVVYELNTILEEGVYVFSEIVKLLRKGISLNQIYILNAGREYLFLFRRLAKSFSIPVELPGIQDIRATPICKQFIELSHKETSFEELFSHLDSTDELYSVLVDIINQYDLGQEKPQECMAFIQKIWKKTAYPTTKWKEAVHLVSGYPVLDDSAYVFLVGFNLGSAPAISKESGFLTDECLSKLGCSTSYEKNELAYYNLGRFITGTKQLVVTYKKYVQTEEYYPSLLIQQLGLMVQHPVIDYGYAKIEDDLRLSSQYDAYIKYGDLTEDIQRYGLSDIPYLSYQHAYSGLSEETLVKHFEKKPLKLAYSNMKLYFACPFSYYADRILGFSEFEPQMAARMGTFSHAVLEDSYDEHFQFDESVLQHKLENCLDAKDEFFFDQMTVVLRNLIAFNREHEAMSQFTTVKREEHIVVCKENYRFEGYIDKLLYTIDQDQVYAAIIDYKTGKDVVSLDNMEDGFHLQLPSYMYLLSHYEPFQNLKLHIIGIYLQKVNIVLYDTKSSVEDQMNKKFRLEGYTVLDLSLIPLLDPTYAQSTYIKSLALGKDGFRSYSKLFLPKQQEEIVTMVDHLIDQAAEGIHHGHFEIAPKMIRQKNESCMYCNYKDVCFSDYKDLVELEYKPFDEKRNEI